MIIYRGKCKKCGCFASGKSSTWLWCQQHKNFVFKPKSNQVIMDENWNVSNLFDAYKRKGYELVDTHITPDGKCHQTLISRPTDTVKGSELHNKLSELILSIPQISSASVNGNFITGGKRYQYNVVISFLSPFFDHRSESVLNAVGNFIERGNITTETAFAESVARLVENMGAYAHLTQNPEERSRLRRIKLVVLQWLMSRGHAKILYTQKSYSDDVLVMIESFGILYHLRAEHLKHLPLDTFPFNDHVEPKRNVESGELDMEFMKCLDWLNSLPDPVFFEKVSNMIADRNFSLNILHT